MKSTYDIAVIGGGPSGMMAAGYAADQGAQVVLLEKTNTLGQKLLITGKGRCNITNASFTLKDLVTLFGKKGKFLYSALHVFNVEDTLEFFKSRGLLTKIERGNRVFPKSDNAHNVAGVLFNFLKKNNVDIVKNAEVLNLKKQGNRIQKLQTRSREFLADTYIICTGGKSYPRTGSTGDGYKWAKFLGHTVIPPSPSLTPLLTKETWIKKAQGLSLKNVAISLYQGKKIDERFGEALFTHEGMSGPIILDLSKTVINRITQGKISLSIDLKPALSIDVLDKRVQRDFNTHINKSYKNSLHELLPRSLIPIIIQLSGISPEKRVNSITKQERIKLVHLLKDMRLTITGFTGYEKAIVTSGGIALPEIDPRTMKSKIIDNLYFAGEVIDLDGPTGGYNLQVCWSTGYLAGSSAATSLKKDMTI